MDIGSGKIITFITDTYQNIIAISFVASLFAYGYLMLSLMGDSILGIMAMVGVTLIELAFIILIGAAATLINIRNDISNLQR